MLAYQRVYRRFRMVLLFGMWPSNRPFCLGLTSQNNSWIIHIWIESHPLDKNHLIGGAKNEELPRPQNWAFLLRGGSQRGICK